jgi:hypothetical protein
MRRGLKTAARVGLYVTILSWLSFAAMLGWIAFKMS